MQPQAPPFWHLCNALAQRLGALPFLTRVAAPRRWPCLGVDPSQSLHALLHLAVCWGLSAVGSPLWLRRMPPKKDDKKAKPAGKSGGGGGKAKKKVRVPSNHYTPACARGGS